MRFLIALGVLLCASCTRPEVSASKAEPATVAVAKAATADLSHDVVLTAEFRPFQEVEVMAKVAGYIRQINVDVGDRVRQGQLLATLEVPELADERTRDEAAVERARADVLRARDELRRSQAVHEIAHLSYQRLSGVAKTRPGLVAQQEIDDAQSKDLTAEAQVAASQSALSVVEQQVHVNSAELAKINTMLDYTRVTAPFAGVVTKRFADKGAMIQAGTASNTQAMPVVRLSENSLLRLTVPVPESAVPTVRVGQRVEARVPTLNRSFSGRVARFADKLDLATRTMSTEIDVQNPDLVLIPGMYAEVHLLLQSRKGVVAIPVTAVDAGETDRRVTVITPENRVEVRKVETGIETPDKVEVKSGLSAGEMVVIGSRSGLQPGQEVRPKVSM
jgi:RND family efflux transporter MFP subunit